MEINIPLIGRKKEQEMKFYAAEWTLTSSEAADLREKVTNHLTQTHKVTTIPA